MKQAILIFGLLLIGNMIFAQTEKSIEERIEVENILPPPPPPPPPPKKAEYFGTIREEMPRFPGCEEEEDKAARKKCADTKMLDFIYSNLIYPEEAKRDSVEGMVVIRFVIEKDGTATDFEIIRDKIGCGCGEAALDVVKKMPNWIPGKQRGKPVRVQFNLPVKFKL